MKVLFFEHDNRFIFGLPLGFRDAGHTILVSGWVSEEKKLTVFFIDFNLI